MFAVLVFEPNGLGNSASERLQSSFYMQSPRGFAIYPIHFISQVCI